MSTKKSTARGAEQASPPADELQRFIDTTTRFLSTSNDRPSRVMEIAAAVGGEIISGGREPGSDLNSVDLARRFGSSRTPVREALAMLEKEGLVEMYSGRRSRVAQLTLSETRELYSVRAAVLALVASEATLHASDEELAEIQEIAGDMQVSVEHGDYQSVYWLNVKFHERLTQIARNSTLQRILDTLVLRSLRLKRLSLSVPTRARRSATDHDWLAQTLLARNSELAAAIAKANVDGAYATIESVLEVTAPQGRGKPKPKAVNTRRKTSGS